jgi:ABC-type nitrate/sulfonate/bicarbonate transport system substrate-binding protein
MNTIFMKRNLPAFAMLAAAVLLLLSLTSCAPKEESEEQAAQSSGETASAEPFVLRSVNPASFNEIYVADALGFFADEHIKIEFIGSLGRGITEVQLLEQEDIDVFTSSHPSQVAQAQLAGVEAVAVAPGMIDDPEYPHMRYLVAPGSPIASLDEAVGKKVGIAAITPCTNGYVEYYLRSKGLDPETVEFVTISDSEAVQTLSEGLVDLVAVHPPFGAWAVENETAKEVSNSWEIFQNPGAGLSVRGFKRDFIEKNPDVVQGFVNAMYRARVWTNAHLEEAQQINAKYFDVDPGTLSSYLYDANKNIDPEHVQIWFTIAEKIGLWNEGDILPDAVFSNDFVPDDIPVSDTDIKWES